MQNMGDDFAESHDQNNQELTTGQRIMTNVVGVSLLAVALTGLGWLHEKGNERVDADLRERLSETQMETIMDAARSETCEMIHPKFQRICVTEERAIKADLETPEL